MKKIASILTAALMACASTSFASIRPAAQPETPFNGKDYVATIAAASYDVENGQGKQSLLIMTAADKKDESKLPGLTIKIDETDLPFGLTLANLVGKQIAVRFADGNYNISNITIITDEYWTGNNKK